MRLKQKFGNGGTEIMTKVLSSIKTPEQNHKNFVIATTNSSKSKRKRFPKMSTPVESVERFIAKSPNSKARNYRSGVADLGHDSFRLQFLKPRLKPTVGCAQSGYSYLDLATLLTSKILGNFPESVIPRLPPKQQEIKANKESESESDEIEPFWRGVFALPSSSEVLFSKRIQIKLDELPSWEPYIAIDSYRFDGENEDDEF